jgi:hypothetical protein
LRAAAFSKAAARQQFVSTHVRRALALRRLSATAALPARRRFRVLHAV